MGRRSNRDTVLLPLDGRGHPARGAPVSQWFRYSPDPQEPLSDDELPYPLFDEDEFPVSHEPALPMLLVLSGNDPIPVAFHSMVPVDVSYVDGGAECRGGGMFRPRR